MHEINKQNKTVPISEKKLKEEFPKTFEYLKRFKKSLKEKKEKYKTNPDYWYSLHRSRELNILERNKIITPQLQNYPSFGYDTQSLIPDAGGYMLIIKDNYLKDINFYYGILNSSLFYHFIKNTSTAFGGNYYYFKTAFISPFKFPSSFDIKMKQNVIKSVDVILKNREKDENFDVSKYERDIDDIVYKLYGLSENEIKSIETKYNFK